MRRCEQCGHTRAYELADGRFKCKSCGHRYTWTTIWTSIRLAEATKRRLLELFVLGVPVYRQRFRAPASAPTILRFYRLIRACCAHVEELREPFEGAIECDETTIGGARRGKRGWGAAGKVIVLGILQRNGQVKVFAVPARKGDRIIGLVRAHTKPGSLYYTDDWHAYGSLRVQGDHVVIRKEKGRPKGRDHLNGIEGFWSYAKNWLYPFRGVPRKHLHLFLGEICYRFNHRSDDLFPLLYKLLRSTGRNEINPILVRNR
jgi:transposase